LLRFLVLCVTALSFLTACGQTTSQKNPPSNFEVPDDPQARIRFLEQFPILNSDGQEAAPTHPDFEGYPLGVLIGMVKKNQGTSCSASHLDSGFVATNAHCVDQNLGPGKYFLIYFDKEGVKKWAPVESFVYVGKPDSDDVAVLKIPAENARQWHTAGKAARPIPIAQATDAEPNPAPVTLPIHIWAFDPFKPAHPDLVQRHGAAGAFFQPRTCQMTRTKPTVVGIKILESGELERTTIHNRNASPALHFFVDQCDRNPIHGNSGSLVTAAGKFGDKIGVYHWGIGTREGKEKYNYLEYTGSNGRPKSLWDENRWQDIFGVGYLFEHFAAAHPQVLF
jgi:hypothetical protein